MSTTIIIILCVCLCRGAEVIQHQIKEREQQRLLDVEKKDQETQAMLKYLERLQEEDMENLQKKRQSQKQLMEEVAQCNEVCKKGGQGRAFKLIKFHV